VLDGGQYSASSYESSSSGTYGDIIGSAGGYGGIADLGATTISGTDNAGGNASYSSYEQTSYASSAGGGGGGGVVGFDPNAATIGNLTGPVAGGSASSSSFEASSSQQQIQGYATNAQGLYQDPNPQVIRRPAQSGQVTYTQNIKIRFLQPPAVPPPGVRYVYMHILFYWYSFHFSH
jgi:hypothetical protein